MRWWTVGMTMVVAAGAAPTTGGAQTQEDWTRPFAPVAVADRMYYVGSAGLGAFLLTSDEGHILIDGTLEENVPALLDNVRSLGYDPADIRIHLVTHAHFDHVGGSAAVVQATGADLLVSEADAPFLREGRDFGLDTDGYAPADVARTLRHLETVRLGDLAVTAHVTPGHTPGCTNWTGTVTVAGQPRRFLLACSLSALGAYRLTGDDPTWPGLAESFCRSLDYLRAQEADVFLANHGQFFGLEEKAAARRAGDEDAFVDPGALDRFLGGAATGIDRARERQGLPACDARDPS
ncbi:MAG: subclass B3 metallo-beta-lactamase [Longimicrobiales bacterium]